MRKVALKRLTKSDLTLFKSQFHKLNVGNQKAINLNADVFVQDLYPGLNSPAYVGGGAYPVGLELYGPGSAPRLTLARHIRKGDTYKNWRLNGEFIANPDDDPGRFDSLLEGDCAILEFEGDPHPSAIRLTLVSQLLDPDLHAECLGILGGSKMLALDPPRVDSLVSVAAACALPLTSTDEAAALEDVALGGVTGALRLQRRTKARPVTVDELLSAKQRAEELGRLGEVLLNGQFRQWADSGVIADYRWESSLNAIAPFDFSIRHPDGTEELVDAKSTSSSFSNPLHVSFAEVRCMAESACTYRIYRVFEAGPDGARCRVSGPMRELAKLILQGVGSLPAYVRSDGFSIDPDAMNWEGELNILPYSEDE